MLELTQAKADGRYSKALQSLAKLDCLIIDDWGLEPLKAAQRNDMMEIMDDRRVESRKGTKCCVGILGKRLSPLD